MRTLQTEKKRTVRWLSTLLLFGVVSTLLSPGGVLADGTPAGTDIDNMAVINYSVGGGGSITIESSPGGNSAVGAGNGALTTFQVDRKVNLAVAEADAAYATVPANGTNVVVTFTVTNTGNATFDFDLSAANRPDGTVSPILATDSDNLDVTILDVYVESDAAGPAATWNSGAHTFDGIATDSGLVISSLPMDYTTNVYVLCNIPADAPNGAIAAVTLTALAQEPGGGGPLPDDDELVADTSGVETVFADIAGDTDAAEDADHSDTDAFLIEAASLTVTKASVVLSDGVNTSNFKAIPGAVIQYSVTIANAAGAETATGVIINDDLSALVSGASAPMVFDTDAYGSGPDRGLEISYDNGGSYTALTNASGDDAGEWSATTPDTVIVNCGDVSAGQTVIVRYQLELQ